MPRCRQQAAGGGRSASRAPQARLVQACPGRSGHVEPHCSHTTEQPCEHAGPTRPPLTALIHCREQGPASTALTAVPFVVHVHAVQPKHPHKGGNGGGIEAVPAVVGGASNRHQHPRTGVAPFQQRNGPFDHAGLGAAGPNHGGGGAQLRRGDGAGPGGRVAAEGLWHALAGRAGWGLWAPPSTAGSTRPPLFGGALSASSSNRRGLAVPARPSRQPFVSACRPPEAQPCALKGHASPVGGIWPHEGEACGADAEQAPGVGAPPRDGRQQGPGPCVAACGQSSTLPSPSHRLWSHRHTRSHTMST